MEQPKLREVDCQMEVKRMLTGEADIFVTMDPGQWDGLLSAAYDEGATLLEVVNERYVKAYKKKSI